MKTLSIRIPDDLEELAKAIAASDDGGGKAAPVILREALGIGLRLMAANSSPDPDTGRHGGLDPVKLAHSLRLYSTWITGYFARYGMEPVASGRGGVPGTGGGGGGREDYVTSTIDPALVAQIGGFAPPEV